MNAAWVAATVRARALSRRRIGREGARRIAASASLEEAVEALGASPYARNLPPSAGPDAARRSLNATALWHLRVLAGWLPPGGAGLLRALTAWYEAANIEDRLAELTGSPAQRPYPLGSIATSWPRLAGASSPGELRRALAASPWGDPGSGDPAEAAVALRLSWARRLAVEVPMASPWAAARAALLGAGAIVSPAAGTGWRLPPGAAADARRLLGHDWQQTTSLQAFAASLPRNASWVLAGITEPTQLWKAEVTWWDRLETDSLALAGAARPGPGPVVGVAALLMADAWRAGAALDAAARHRQRELADVLG